MVTNPNCSTIGLVLALKPLEERFGIEQIFVTTMQAVSGAGYPGVPSMDILGNVVPYIGSEEEKMEAETLKLLGHLEGHHVTPLAAKITAHCNRVPVDDGHTECVSIKFGNKLADRHARRFSPRGPSSSRSPARDLPYRARAARAVCARSPTAPSRASIAIADAAWPSPWAACAPAVCSTGSSCALAQHHARRRRRSHSERGTAGQPRQARSPWPEAAANASVADAP